jgi:prepilin signal peptidase PulO-like enzyme (type II secretory pathway)
LKKKVSPKDLVEGDWLVEDVVVNGKKIVKKGGIGVTKKDVALLQDLHKKGIVDKVTVKDGIPFVPTFLIAFIINYLLGNVLLLFV